MRTSPASSDCRTGRLLRRLCPSDGRVAASDALATSRTRTVGRFGQSRRQHDREFTGIRPAAADQRVASVLGRRRWTSGGSEIGASTTTFHWPFASFRQTTTYCPFSVAGFLSGWLLSSSSCRSRMRGRRSRTTTLEVERQGEGGVLHHRGDALADGGDAPNVGSVRHHHDRVVGVDADELHRVLRLGRGRPVLDQGAEGRLVGGTRVRRGRGCGRAAACRRQGTAVIRPRLGAIVFIVPARSELVDHRDADRAELGHRGALARSDRSAPRSPGSSETAPTSRCSR